MGIAVARLAASGVLFVLGFACASSESSQAGSPTPAQDIPGYTKSAPLTLEQYCDARVAMHAPWISYYQKCCVDNEERLYSSGLVDDLNYASTEACIAHLTELQKSLAFTYVGTYANAALEELSGLIPAAPATCSGTHFGEQLTAALSERGKRLDAIRAVLQGAIAENGTCKASLECKFGLVCGGSAGSYTCRPRSAGACVFSDSCVEGMDCVSERCQVPASAGSPCTLQGECPFGLVCAAGRCSVGGGAGALCSDSEACKVGYGCATAMSSCVALKVTGDTCLIDGECAGRCAKGRCIGRCGGTGSF
jgi:hypothetical protein